MITQSINFRTSENNQDIIDSVIANTAKKWKMVSKLK